MAKYRTKQFDRLDRVVNQRYGNTERQIVEFVLTANPGLELYGIILPMGILIDLPDPPQKAKNAPAVIKQIMIWE